MNEHERRLMAVAVRCAEQNEAWALQNPNGWGVIFETIASSDVVCGVIREEGHPVVLPLKNVQMFNALLHGEPLGGGLVNALFVADRDQAREMADAFTASAPTIH